MMIVMLWLLWRGSSEVGWMGSESGDSKDLLNEEMGKCSGELSTKEQGDQNHIVSMMSKSICILFFSLSATIWFFVSLFVLLSTLPKKRMWVCFGCQPLVALTTS